MVAGDVNPMMIMKPITCLAAFSLGLATLSAPAFAAELAGWTTNLEAAFETAKKEKKDVLVEFTGSDWCPPCIAMRKNVFSKKEFVDGASKNYVLVEIDMPQKDKETAKKNQPLVEKYKIEGFPTVILLTSEGKEYSRFFASEFPKVDLFLKKLAESRDRKDLD
jgi:thiol:disulfide interchange protein